MLDMSSVLIFVLGFFSMVFAALWLFTIKMWSEEQSAHIRALQQWRAVLNENAELLLERRLYREQFIQRPDREFDHTRSE